MIANFVNFLRIILEKHPFFNFFLQFSEQLEFRFLSPNSVKFHHFSHRGKVMSLLISTLWWCLSVAAEQCFKHTYSSLNVGWNAVRGHKYAAHFGLCNEHLISAFIWSFPDALQVAFMHEIQDWQSGLEINFFTHSQNVASASKIYSLKWNHCSLRLRSKFGPNILILS